MIKHEVDALETRLDKMVSKGEIDSHQLPKGRDRGTYWSVLCLIPDKLSVLIPRSGSFSSFYGVIICE